MSREEEILRELHPDGCYTEAESRLVGEVLRILDRRGVKSPSLPSRFVPIGGIVNIRGRNYRCELRGEVHHWMDCCSGCSLRGIDCPASLQCSKFDRRDGRNVWFRAV